MTQSQLRTTSESVVDLRRHWIRKLLSPKPPLPPIDPAEVLREWPIGEFDPSVAALVRSSAAVTEERVRPGQGVLASPVVAILEPSAVDPGHYRMFDGTGTSIGVVVVRRARGSLHEITDHMIQFVDGTGSAFVLDWWSSKTTRAWSGETSATVRQGGDWRVLGRCSADHKGRWLAGDSVGNLVAYVDRRSKETLRDHAGAPIATLGMSRSRSTWPWRRSRCRYSNARIVAFEYRCDPVTRALALSTMLCAEVQALEDLGVDLDFGD